MPAEQAHNTISLFSRIAEGDERAFKEMFDTFWEQVYGTTYRFTKSTEEAKDIAQDIFMRLWENREKLKGVENPQSYIYIFSRNMVMDRFRKKVLEPSNIDYLIGYFKSDAASAQDKMELKELETMISQAVDTLPGRVKDVFRLSRYEGLTHQEIAERLNISVLSSQKYIVRALRQIREYLASHSDEQTFAMILLILISR